MKAEGITHSSRSSHPKCWTNSPPSLGNTGTFRDFHITQLLSSGWSTAYFILKKKNIKRQHSVLFSLSVCCCLSRLYSSLPVFVSLFLRLVECNMVLIWDGVQFWDCFEGKCRSSCLRFRAVPAGLCNFLLLILGLYEGLDNMPADLLRY